MPRCALPPRPKSLLTATTLAAVLLAGFVPAASADTAPDLAPEGTTSSGTSTPPGPRSFSEELDAAASEHGDVHDPEFHHTGTDAESHEHSHEVPEGWEPDPNAPPEPLAFVDEAPDVVPEAFAKEQPSIVIEPSTAQDLTLTSSPDSVPAPPSKRLPAQLDAAPGWQYQYSCDPSTKPGIYAFGNLVGPHYGKPYYTTARSCGYGAMSEHYDGRALDWPMDATDKKEKAIGDAVAHWITANNGEMAKRFGIQSVIWNKKSWYLYSPGSWRTYTGPSPHTDHLHFSFTWDGAMKRTSWWDGTPVTAVDHGTCRVYSGQYAPRYTGRRTAPCSRDLPEAPTTDRPVRLPCVGNNAIYITSCSRNTHVTWAQERLGVQGDGLFGPGTLGVLMKYQAKHGLPVTGVLDNATWAKMAAVAAPKPAPKPNPNVDRVEGEDRYGTAAALSSNYPAGVPVAYIANGTDYPDALTAAARAGAEGGPVLLTRQGGLPGVTGTELRRLRPQRIVVLGGSKAVSETVLRSLQKYADKVTRVAGNDRYGTAAKLTLGYPAGADVAYIATGADYPDALAGAARAGTVNGPVLLTKQNTLPRSTIKALNRLRPKQIAVLGGSTVISGTLMNELKRYARANTADEVFRMAGGDRYATAADVAERYRPGVDTVYVATGRDYPDALSGAARAGRMHGPVLLVRPGGIPSPTHKQLERLDPDRIVVLGGTKAVSTTVERQLGSYVP